MSTLKTVTSALTAAVLVTGIGLAWAQTEDQPQNQPTDPMAAATATPTSEQTPADPNAIPSTDSSTAAAQQQQPVDDPARATPPVDSTAPLPSDSTTSSTNSATSSTATMPDNSYTAPAATTTAASVSPKTLCASNQALGLIPSIDRTTETAAWKSRQLPMPPRL